MPTTPPQISLQKHAEERESSSFFSNPQVHWGIVVAQQSELFAVDVRLLNGLLLQSVPVLSPTWAGENDDRAFGTRDIPPIDGEVLVLLPGGQTEFAAVLPVSRLGLTDKMKVALVQADKARESLTVTEAGWSVTYDKDTGDVTFQTPSGNNQITIKVDRTNGVISVTQKTGSSTKNEIVLDGASGITVTDTNGNTLVMDSTSVRVNGNLEVLR
jgi:hypothetical protein